MTVICISDIARWLNKSSFYDVLQSFEDFCFYIDKSFKKTYKPKVIDTGKILVYSDSESEDDDVALINISELSINDIITEKHPKLTQEQIKEVKSLVNKKHGNETEPQQIPKDVKNQIRYRKKINDKITISGMVDYIENDTIYEIKARTSRLFYRVYTYEMIQIQLYMYVSGIHKARLKEHLNGEINIIDVEYDKQFCYNILNELCDYYDKIVVFLDNRNEYYKTDDKLAFIKQLRGF